MRTISQLISLLNEHVGKAVSGLNVLLVVLICVDVVARYAFKHSSAAFYELEWHLFSLVFLIGAGWTLRHDQHVRVDILYAKANPRLQAMLDIIGVALLLMPFSLTLIVTALPYALVAFQTSEGSPDTGGLPYRWIIKSAIVIGAVLILLQGIAMLLEKALFLISGKERATHVA
jgi:TRAP-type mannitol/chloroaromatic compound transport system permease small subunit